MNVTRKCALPDCGREFTVKFRSNRGKYCSLKCSGAAKTAAAAERRADDYDLQWAERRQDQRVGRWLPILDAGVWSLRARDRHGIQRVWERTVQIGDWQAFFTAALAYIAELQDERDGEREEGAA